MSFRTNEPIEVKFEGDGDAGVRYIVGPYRSMNYLNREQAGRAAAARFPKLMIDGRALADVMPATANVEPAPAPISPTVAAEIALAEEGKLCAVVEKKRKAAGKAKAPKPDGPPPMLWT